MSIRTIILTGAPSSGKSTLVYKFIQSIPPNQYYFIETENWPDNLILYPNTKIIVADDLYPSAENVEKIKNFCVHDYVEAAEPNKLSVMIQRPTVIITSETLWPDHFRWYQFKLNKLEL